MLKLLLIKILDKLCDNRFVAEFNRIYQLNAGIRETLYSVNRSNMDDSIEKVLNLYNELTFSKNIDYLNYLLWKNRIKIRWGIDENTHRFLNEFVLLLIRNAEK